MTQNAETFFVSVGPTRVRVRTVGNGPPLLLLMGIGGNLSMWDPLVPHLSGRRLLMFDFPGTGGSGASFLPPTMGFNALLTKAVLKRLGAERADVLGYSWGGILAQHLAVQHPRTVRRLVLACTTVGLGGVPPTPRVTARMLTPRRYYSRDYFAKVAPDLYGGRYRWDDSLVNDEANRRIHHPPGYLGYVAQLMAISGYSTLPGLPFITAPTLILAGDDDPIVAVSNQRILGAFIRHSETHVIQGAGHLLLVDAPADAARFIGAFLSRGDDPAPDDPGTGDSP